MLEKIQVCKECRVAWYYKKHIIVIDIILIIDIIDKRIIIIVINMLVLYDRDRFDEFFAKYFRIERFSLLRTRLTENHSDVIRLIVSFYKTVFSEFLGKIQYIFQNHKHVSWQIKLSIDW